MKYNMSITAGINFQLVINDSGKKDSITAINNVLGLNSIEDLVNYIAISYSVNENKVYDISRIYAATPKSILYFALEGNNLAVSTIGSDIKYENIDTDGIDIHIELKGNNETKSYFQVD